jgi:hypothetical protein
MQTIPILHSDFVIHNFDSPHIYPLPISTDQVSVGWQLDSLSGDCVSIEGFHGYCGFFTDFKISWLHDGQAKAVFRGIGGGGFVVEMYELNVFATSGP